MKRALRQQEQNLDPLLDTMANVVGILVMLVAVSQLPLAGAVDRIRLAGAGREVSQQAVERLERQHAELEETLAAAGERLAELESSGHPGLLLPEAVPLLDELTALPERSELRGLGSRELQVRVDADRAELERSRERVERSRRRATQLALLLRDLPAEPRPKIARLPDPRPPPAGSRPLSFLCRHGRIVPVDVDQMRVQLRRGIAAALGERRPLQWEDRMWAANLFEKLDIGHAGLHWVLREERGSTLFADLRVRDPEQGESLTELRLGGPEYTAQLRKQSPQEHYARYFVWPDSFDVYLEARYLAESQGYPVSWAALDLDEDVGLAIVGQPGLRLPVLVD